MSSRSLIFQKIIPFHATYVQPGYYRRLKLRCYLRFRYLFTFAAGQAIHVDKLQINVKLLFPERLARFGKRKGRTRKMIQKKVRSYKIVVMLIKLFRVDPSTSHHPEDEYVP
ncbi:hypothetical protein OUZ56_027578 [Daphnia magna]|uniref:Uncharacterized protein n=1 Tax=Daphnia magna TaxID=35525 RepID=A0ABR0B1B7_9CRUS|nr:hypothetical protein OUZ56_027578 [Daphnia magna]